MWIDFVNSYFSPFDTPLLYQQNRYISITRFFLFPILRYNYKLLISHNKQNIHQTLFNQTYSYTSLDFAYILLPWLSQPIKWWFSSYPLKLLRFLTYYSTCDLMVFLRIIISYKRHYQWVIYRAFYGDIFSRQCFYYKKKQKNSCFF